MGGKWGFFIFLGTSYLAMLYAACGVMAWIYNQIGDRNERVSAFRLFIMTSLMIGAVFSLAVLQVEFGHETAAFKWLWRLVALSIFVVSLRRIPPTMNSWILVVFCSGR